MLRYNTRETLPDLLDDVTHAALLRELVDWAASNALVRQLADVRRGVVMAGHSRGAKLATLAAAGDARVTGGWGARRGGRGGGGPLCLWPLGRSTNSKGGVEGAPASLSRARARVLSGVSALSTQSSAPRARQPRPAPPRPTHPAARSRTTRPSPQSNARPNNARPRAFSAFSLG